MTALVPKQNRSRETLRRLLDATEGLLREGGLEAATVPAIAERAGVSVGVVYRRFPDKDMLLRAVHDRFFERTTAANRERLEAVARLHLKPAVLLRALILGMVQGYRQERVLLRALVRYSRSHPDPEFKRAARDMNRAATKAIVDLLLRDEKAFDHPDPAAAIHFAIISIASTLQTVVLEEEPVHGLRTPAKLEEELVRMAFGYLGLK